MKSAVPFGLWIVACALLGCANESGGKLAEPAVSFQDAMATCAEYCDTFEGGSSCAIDIGPRCYDNCLATYETRSVSRCSPYRRCDRDGYCIEETMWAYFGCPANGGCSDVEGGCGDAMRALMECQIRWEEETPMWCEENCTTTCETETEYAPGFGRSCLVPCEGDADCPSGSHCNLDYGNCVSECEWRRRPDGTRVTVFCGPEATCDKRGCCTPRSGLSRTETGSYCDPP